MNVNEICDDGEILARHIPASELWGNGLKFFSAEEDYIQVGTWGYDSGKTLSAHIHNQTHRDILWTQEVLLVRTGCIRATIYNSLEHKVATVNVLAGDIIILLRGGHGYEILEDGTTVLEIKNGPYLGPEIDRRRI